MDIKVSITSGGRTVILKGPADARLGGRASIIIGDVDGVSSLFGATRVLALGDVGIDGILRMTE